MKVVPLSSAYLSTENGGTNHASAALSDGIGIYTTQEDEYAKAIAYLNGKYGDDALKDEKSLKKYVLDNGTVADKELAEKLDLVAVKESLIGGDCDDKNPQTKNDKFLDKNFTCKGEKIYNSVKCKDDPIGKNILVDGVSYLVVNNDTIRDNLDRAETLCTSNVTDMHDLFYSNTSFNQPIGNWDVSNVTNMSWMFGEATSFDQEIGDWDVSNVIDMSWMFYLATSFNQPLNWDTSNVTTMSEMFRDITLFNQPIGDWDVSNVIDMSWMFEGATSFNQPIGDWDTSNVTDMSWMFGEATSFDQEIGGWDTSNVTDMSYMFYGVILFNQPLNWDTSNVTNMSNMFYLASSFNQPIENWVTSNVTDYTDFAINSALTSANAPSKNATKFPTE